MPRKLVDMEITAVAGVDRAANKRTFLIIKRARNEPDKGGVPVGWIEKARQFLSSIFKMEEKAKTLAEVQAHQEAMHQWWNLQDALWSSLYSIRESEEDAATKTMKLRQTVEEFMAQAQPLITQMGDVHKTETDEFIKGLQKLGPDGAELGEVIKALSDARTQRVLAPDPDPKVNKKEGEDTVPTIEDVLKSLTTEQRQTVEAELAKRQPAKTEIPGEVSKRLADLETKAGQFDDLQKRAEKAETDLKAAKDELVKMRDESETKQYLEKAAKYPAAGTPEQVAAKLRKAYSLSEEYGKEIEADLERTETLTKQAKLFESIGKSGQAPEGSAEAKIEKMAKERAAADKVSFEKAYDLVIQENRELYKQLRTEQEGK